MKEYHTGYRPEAAAENLSDYLAYYHDEVYRLDTALWECVANSPHRDKAAALLEFSSRSSMSSADDMTERIQDEYPGVFE